MTEIEQQRGATAAHYRRNGLLAITILLILQCCKPHSENSNPEPKPQRQIHSCIVLKKEIEGGDWAFNEIGRIKFGEWANELDAFLTDDLENWKDLPLIGTLARLEFIDSAGTVICAGSIYFPDGDLLVSEPHRKCGKFIELNKRVLEIVKEKDPETIELFERLRKHGITIERLIEPTHESPKE